MSTMPANTMRTNTMPMETMPANTMPANTMPANTMPTFQLETMIPADGRFAFVFPEFLRGQTVEFSVKPKEAVHSETQDVKIPAAEYEEDYVTAIRRFRGIFSGTPDLSDLRDEEDREI